MRDFKSPKLPESEFWANEESKDFSLMSFSISDWKKKCLKLSSAKKGCQNRLNDWPFSNTQTQRKKMLKKSKLAGWEIIALRLN